jgi:hypothetical protein
MIGKLASDSIETIVTGDVISGWRSPAREHCSKIGIRIAMKSLRHQQIDIALLRASTEGKDKE